MLFLASSLATPHAPPDGPRLAARRTIPEVALKVWSASGTVRFVAWDKDSVVVAGTVAPTARLVVAGDSSGVKVAVEAIDPGGTSTADPSFPGQSSAKRPTAAERSALTIYLPRRGKVSVKGVATDITATDVAGWFYTVSGTIRLSGRASSIEVESMNGTLDLDVTTPWIRARAGDGGILLRGDPEDADVSTIGGPLNIAASHIMRGQFASVTGDIHFAGAPASGAILDFSDHAGAVELSMPRTTSAVLALSTVSGTIDNGLAGIHPAAAPAKTTRVILGHGDAQMTIRTFKGAIRLRPL